MGRWRDRCQGAPRYSRSGWRPPRLNCRSLARDVARSAARPEASRFVDAPGPGHVRAARAGRGRSTQDGIARTGARGGGCDRRHVRRWFENFDRRSGDSGQARSRLSLSPLPRLGLGRHSLLAASGLSNKGLAWSCLPAAAALGQRVASLNGASFTSVRSRRRRAESLALFPPQHAQPLSPVLQSRPRLPSSGCISPRTWTYASEWRSSPNARAERRSSSWRAATSPRGA